MFAPETKILLVDDSQMQRELIWKMLVDLEFKNIEFAEDGQDAWNKIQEAQDNGKPYELIISDINMPVLDGHHLLAKFRSKEVFNHIPFMIISARGKERDVEEGLALGANNYITKPFAKNELFNGLKKLHDKVSKA